MPMNYQYLPEMQGVTQNQQQQYTNQMQQGRDRMNKSFARTGLQSGGSYIDAIANLNAKQAQGLSSIERENIYKNALLGREERLKKEAYERQKDWLNYQNEAAYNMQNRQQARQRQWSLEDAIPNYLGALAGGIANKGVNFLTGGIGNLITQGKFDYNPNAEYETLMKDYLRSQIGGQKPTIAAPTMED